MSDDGSGAPPRPSDPRLDARRNEIRAIDIQLIDLVHRRTQLAEEIGEIKQELGLPIRNFAVEAKLLDESRAACEERGIAKDVGEELVRILIRESIRVQERERVGATRRFEDGRALVVGGSGHMGAWFTRYLDNMGYRVATFDPAGPLDRFPSVDDLEAAAPDYDVIILSTPPAIIGSILKRLEGSTRGLVVEISSLKSPFTDAFRDAMAGGMRVASIHPMWGAATTLLANKNLVICDAGDAEANREAAALFRETAANVVTIPFADHDAYMAATLGLPHAMNLMFSQALTAFPFAYADLKHLGGPTFVKQVRVAHEVADENADLYHQIQKLNAHTPEVYARIRQALDAFEKSVADGAASFRAYANASRAYFGSEEIP